MAVGLNWRAIDWRAWARTREFTTPQLQRGLEIALIGVVAISAAGLAWALFAPTDSPDAQSGAPVRFDSSPSAFAAFDPFFRLSSGSGSTVITSLNLTLHGVRADQASGRGSAIIGLPDGVQNSYAVGDEIVPGAVLAAVHFDSVAIRRNGALETLYLDQSTEAPVAQTPGAGATQGPDPFAAIRAPGSLGGAPSLIADISAEPRMRGGRIDGYVLKPGSMGSAFAAAGFQPGDILLTINGKNVGDGVGLEQLASGGQPVSVEVERAGKSVSLTVGGRK